MTAAAARSIGALDAEIGDVGQHRTHRPVRKRLQRALGVFGAGPGPIQRLRQGAVPPHEGDGPAEILDLPPFPAEDPAPESLLLLIAPAVGENDRQGDLALGEVIAHGLAQIGLPGGIVEHVIDKLEGDAEIQTVGFQRLGLGRAAGPR